MAANLYPGIKALHLILDTPYDLIRTDDIRDDLVGVKVWLSNTQGFDPSIGQGTLVFDGLSFSITISNLLPNTRYYVKYAFISAIEPTNYTISQELTAVVYDENVRVYGYLTNDPTGIATQADGTGGDFSLATGVFKVYDLSQDVTGNGPQYSIKSDSVYHLTGATIDAATGVYSCTGLTQNSGSVTFLAVYDGITVEQVWNVYRGVAGASAPLIQLSATNSDFVFKDEFATTPETTQTVLTAALKNITGTPVFTAEAYTRAGVSLGSVSFTQVDNQITITGTQFSALGVTVGAVVVTATIGTVSDSFTIYRINDGTEQITVELSNSAHVIPAANNGDTLPANYVGSGTTIKVKQGNTYLPVDPTSPYEVFGSWNIFEINASNIVADPTPTIGSDYINFDTHAAMTADTAYIEYVIAYRTTSGVEGTQKVVQSFAKSKEGVVGASAPAVSITAPRLAFVTLKNNSGTVPPNNGGITLTATVSNITNPQYSWKVDGVAVGTNSSTYTIPFFSNVGAKKVQVDVSGTGGTQAFDVFSVYHITEGSDTITVGLSNENQTISCDNTGTPISGQFPITITTGVFQGIEQLTSPTVVYSKVPGSETGMTSSINSTTGVITINSITEAFAEVTYSFTVGTVVVYKTITLNKSIDGASAPIVRLAAEPQVFVQPKNTGTPYPSTTTLTATEINIPNAVFAWYVDGVLQTGITIDTLTLNSFAPVASKLVKVVATGTGGITAFDQLTLYSIAEGDDSYQAGITNESRTLTANSSGTIYGGQLPITAKMNVVRGTEVYGTGSWTSGITFSPATTTQAGLTATINSSGDINVSGSSFTADSTEFTFTATITTPSGNLQLSRKMLFTKTRDGESIQGPQGLLGINTKIIYRLLSQTAAVPSTPANTTNTAIPSGWTEVATAINPTVGTIVWYSYGRVNNNSVEVDGIPQLTTVWSVPTAASVFQDIRSDNWNGSSPPVITQPGTWGTTGYYLSKANGNVFADGFFARGNVVINGSGTNINYTGFSIGCDVNFNKLANIGVAGQGNDDTSVGSVGVVGYLGNNLQTYASGAVVEAVRGIVGQNPRTSAGYNVGIGVRAYNMGVGNTGIPGSGGIALKAESNNGKAVHAINNQTYGGYAIYAEGKSHFTGSITADSTISAIGNITSQSNIIAYQSSDINLKENITVLNDPLTKLNQLSGYNYTWKESYLQENEYDKYPDLIKKHDVGVIAQEVEKVLPEAVVTRKDGTLAVNYEKLIPLIIEAIKELDRRTR